MGWRGDAARNPVADPAVALGGSGPRAGLWWLLGSVAASRASEGASGDTATTTALRAVVSTFPLWFRARRPII